MLPVSQEQLDAVSVLEEQVHNLERLICGGANVNADKDVLILESLAHSNSSIDNYVEKYDNIVKFLSKVDDLNKWLDSEYDGTSAECNSKLDYILENKEEFDHLLSQVSRISQICDNLPSDTFKQVSSLKPRLNKVKEQVLSTLEKTKEMDDDVQCLLSNVAEGSNTVTQVVCSLMSVLDKEEEKLTKGKLRK